MSDRLRKLWKYFGPSGQKECAESVHSYTSRFESSDQTQTFSQAFSSKAGHANNAI